MLTRILGCLWCPHTHPLGMGIWEEEGLGSLNFKVALIAFVMEKMDIP